MRTNIPLRFKYVFGYFCIVLITFGFQMLLLNQDTLSTPTEAEIESIHSKKGLYLYPRYEIQVDESDFYSKVTKQEYEQLKVGDTISGFLSDNSFKTKTERAFEFRLGILIQIVLYLVTFFMGAGLLSSMKWVKRKGKLKTALERVVRTSVLSILALYFIVGFIFVLLIAVNGFHKLNKWNLVETRAIAYDGASETYNGNGAFYTVHELFLVYFDEEENMHLSRKAVTSKTFQRYLEGDKIDIYYRKNNVNDTFIKTESPSEILFAIFNVLTLFIALYIASVISVLIKWRKKRDKKDILEWEDTT